MSFIEEVKDVGSDLKKTLGNNGFYLLIAAAGAFGLYNLLKNDRSSEYVSATGYASYPDVGENSEVVIDSINNELWASHDEIMGAIDTSESEIIQNMNEGFEETNEHIDEHFEATNDYINEGLQSQAQLIDKVESVSRVEYYPSNDMINLIQKSFNEQQGAIKQATMENKKALNDLANQMSKAYAANAAKNTSSSTAKKTTTSTAKKTTTSTAKKTTTTAKSNKTSTKNATSAAKKTASTTSPATYNYTTKKGLNTSQSIVDALKATGADSSMAARKKIAAANGIKNYTGTAAQNTKMLNMMKSGDLVKPTSTSKSSSKTTKKKK